MCTGPFSLTWMFFPTRAHHRGEVPPPHERASPSFLFLSLCIVNAQVSDRRPTAQRHKPTDARALSISRDEASKRWMTEWINGRLSLYLAPLNGHTQATKHAQATPTTATWREMNYNVGAECEIHEQDDMAAKSPDATIRQRGKTNNPLNWTNN